MNDRFFPMIKKPIAYEGPGSDNPLAFKWYDAQAVIAGKTMAEHLRFAVAYWHTFVGNGADHFGAAVYDRPWRRATDPMQVAFDTMDAAFEFMAKLNVPFWCFHDRDIAPEGETVAQSSENLSRLVEKAAGLQEQSGVRLLWSTANLLALLSIGRQVSLVLTSERL